jgi:hypothetical protein
MFCEHQFAMDVGVGESVDRSVDVILGVPLHAFRLRMGLQRPCIIRLPHSQNNDPAAVISYRNASFRQDSPIVIYSDIQPALVFNCKCFMRLS